MLRVILLLVLALSVTQCATGKNAVTREKEASAHFKMGLSFLNENSLQQAYVEFQKALDLAPDNKEYLYALGHVYFGQERYKEAEETFRKAIKIDPDYSEAHNYLGKVLEMEGKSKEAVAEYEEALKNPLYSTPQLPRFNLGNLYMTQGQYPDALKEYQEALKLDPSCNESTCALSHNGMGRTYFQMGRVKDAIDSYREAVKAFPNYVDAHYNLAFAYLKQGAKGEAAKEFKKVIDLSPESDKAHESRKFLEALK
jgi:type IV pilus assembly protein PilF